MDRLELANRPRYWKRPGSYEAWYVTCNQPEQRRGFWLRYTTFNPGPKSSAEPHAALWAFAFHRDAPERNRALKQVLPLAAARHAEPFALGIGGAAIDLRGCRGELTSGAGSAKWDLSWTSHAEPFFFLEPRWQRLASTANAGAQPALQVGGWIEIGGERFDLDRAPGGQQHTWGRRHALEWNWAFAAGLGDRRGDYLDGVATRLRGPGGTQLAGTALGLHLAGRRLSLNSLPRTLRQGAAISPAGWDVEVEDGHLRAEVSVRPQRDDLIGVTYDDPDGGRRVCYHTEVADLEVRLFERGSPVATVVREAAAAFEYASETALPGLPPRL